jgi:Ca2+-dependent lipid-binding protein
LNPFWDDFTLSLEELCYGDLSWPIKITIFDHNDRKKHKEIGSCESTIQEMTQRISVRGNADRERAFEIMKEGKTKTRGLIVVLQAEVQLEGGG